MEQEKDSYFYPFALKGASKMKKFCIIAIAVMLAVGGCLGRHYHVRFR